MKKMLLVNVAIASASVIAATAIVSSINREKARAALYAESTSKATIVFYEEEEEKNTIEVLPGEDFTIRVKAESSKEGVDWSALDINVYMGLNTDYVTFKESQLITDIGSTSHYGVTSGNATEQIAGKKVYHVGFGTDDELNYSASNIVEFEVTFTLKDTATEIFDQYVGFYLYPSSNKYTYSDSTFERTQIGISNSASNQLKLKVAHETNTITYLPGDNGVGDAVVDTKIHDQENYTLAGYNQYVLKGDIFTREGYTQVGWATSEEKATADYALNANFNGNEDIVLYPVWEQNSYEISFNYQGATAGFETASKDVVFGEAVAELPTPTKTGSNFIGWFDAATDGNEYTAETVYSLTDDVTLFAHWEEIPYTISFEENGGSTVEDIVKNYNETVAAPANPERSGYTFNGWYENEQLTGSVYVFSKMPANDVTLYAKWTVIPYTISYSLDGGSVSGSNPTTYNVTTETIDLIAPTKTGYEFLGWTGSNGSTPETAVSIEQGSTGNKEFTANWAVKQYTISFEENGGSEVVDITQDYNTTVTSPAAPTKSGYTFEGWYVNEDLSGSKYVFTKMPANDVALYAKWTLNTYTISYNLVGGTESAANPTTYDVTTPDIAVANPTRTGYTFEGWTGEGIEDPTTSLTIAQGSVGDREYTANWSVNEYTITFEENGGSEVADITQNFGTTITPPAAPTREGYTFDGWDKTIPTTMPAENITVSAKWKVNSYTITLFSGSTETPVSTIVTVYNEDIVSPADPIKTGYTFEGWFLTSDYLGDAYVFEKMPAKDFDLYAKWTQDVYTLEYNLDGGSVAVANPESYTVSTPSFSLNNPTKEGYTFLGWTEGEDTTEKKSVSITKGSTGNKVFTANWSVNQYTISFEEDGGSEVVDITQDYGTDITKPEDPTKEGYTFVGWDKEIPDTMPAENVTISAVWEADVHQVTFDMNGGEGENVSRDQTYDEAIGELPVATWTGHEFDGWYTAAEGGEKIAPTTIFKQTADTVYYAHWTANTYTLTYNANGGSAVTPGSKTVTYGVAYGAFPETTKSGYSLVGWFTEVDGGSEVTPEDIYELTSSSIIYAHWEQVGQDVTFDMNGGDLENVVKQVSYDDQLGELPAASKTGYTFVGWFTAADAGEQVTATTVFKGTEATTYYAHYTVDKHKITFDANGGSAVAPISANYGTAVTAPAKPSKEGYSFQGWYVDDDTFENEFEFTTMPAEDIELHAKWVREVIQIKPAEGSDPTKTYDFLALVERESSYEYDGETYTDAVFYRESYTQIEFVHGNEAVGTTVILGNITPKTTVNEFLANIDVERQYLRITDFEGNVIFENGEASAYLLANTESDTPLDDWETFAISTGTKLELVIDGVVKDTVILSVLGDTNGDGLANGNDYDKMRDWIVAGEVNKQELAYILACYIRNDGAYERVLTSDEYQELRNIVKSGVQETKLEGYFTYNQEKSDLDFVKAYTVTFNANTNKYEEIVANVARARFSVVYTSKKED